MRADKVFARQMARWAISAFLISSSMGWAQARPAKAAAGAEARTAQQLESIRGSGPKLWEFLRRMPKGGDLHNHLSGAVYAESYIRWAAEKQMCIELPRMGFVAGPCDEAVGKVPAAKALADPTLHTETVNAMSLRQWHPARRPGHHQFFEAFGKFGTISRQMWGEMMAEVAERAAEQNELYLELMLAVDNGRAFDLAKQLKWDDDFDAMLGQLRGSGLANVVTESRQGLEAAQARMREVMQCGSDAAGGGCGVTVRFLGEGHRGLPREVVFAELAVAFEAASQDESVVGVNLVMPEDWLVPMRDYRMHMWMIRNFRAKYPKVKVSLHAGELAAGLVPTEGLRSHIRSAVEYAGADRIGHGTDIMHEDNMRETLALMARRKVLVEVCPTSADAILGIRGSEHPLRLYMEAGVPVMISTDDEGVARSSITQELVKAVEEHKLTYAELKKMQRASLEHAFVDEATRKKLLTELEARFAKFEAGP